MYEELCKQDKGVKTPKGPIARPIETELKDLTLKLQD